MKVVYKVHEMPLLPAGVKSTKEKTYQEDGLIYICRSTLVRITRSEDTISKSLAFEVLEGFDAKVRKSPHPNPHRYFSISFSRNDEAVDWYVNIYYSTVKKAEDPQKLKPGIYMKDIDPPTDIKPQISENPGG